MEDAKLARPSSKSTLESYQSKAFEDGRSSRKPSLASRATDTDGSTSYENFAETARGRSSDQLQAPASKSFELQRQVSPAIGASAAPDLARVQTGRSTLTNATNATNDPGFEVDFEEDGSDDPKEWSLAFKSLVIFFMSYSTAVVVMHSTAYASGIPGMQISFAITDKTLLVLGITTYLLGLAAGSVVLAPISEMYGRRPVYIGSLIFFIVLVVPCGLAKTLETILVARFFGAFAGAAMISNAPGTVADIVTEEYRALAFSIWSIGPMNGPVIGPIVGGFVYQALGWRWTNWVVVISSSIALIIISTVSETYAPALLRRKAAKLRSTTGDSRYWSRYDSRAAFWSLLKINLSRPFIMTVTEPICIFWDVYIAIVYAILYLCFVAYPIVFSQQRGFSPGMTGLAYAGIGVGGLITISSEPLLRRLINSYRPNRALPPGPNNAAPPEAMLSIVCIAAVLIPTGALTFAWTSPPHIHWIWPILAGIPFGMGNCGLFIYSGAYLINSYGIYAASALAGNAVLRSITGGCLPLAGPMLYEKLGSQWAGTLLGGLEVLCIPIPFVFWKYGERIRGKSALIREMREDQESLERKKRSREDKAKRLVGKAGGSEFVEQDVPKARMEVVEKDLV